MTFIMRLYLLPGYTHEPTVSITGGSITYRYQTVLIGTRGQCLKRPKLVCMGKKGTYVAYSIAELVRKMGLGKWGRSWVHNLGSVLVKAEDLP